MKALLLLSALALVSCSTDAAGNKAFLGLTTTQWIGVGEDAAKGAVISYGTRRLTTSAKQPVSVMP